MAATSKPTLGKGELSIIRELADILRETDLSDIEVERGDLKLKISRRAAKQIISAGVMPQSAPMAQPQPMAPETPAPDSAVDMSAHPGALLSPMVGTAYLSPEPGKSAFVKIGDQVSEGDTLMLIEAMKTFNPIAATKAGKVIDIIVEDGQPVEFDEPLIIIG
ncbi:Biotin carboxyl carrier protein of acetyl-CoA carboxylase [hydrothermal vent metagenome]|uniref:Biotin carboxyl carrier protein of acetyl-CoA carboxylase n=1 Tax=hydrothermal vent metagenome TaxID=652676 RepID=A0A3B0RPV4_9ZZZZ